MAAGTAVFALFVAVWQRVPADQFPRLSLVVLPFENAGSDQADDYLADAITDDLTSDLSHIADAKVIARSLGATLQGQTGGRAAGRPRPRCALRAERERSPGRQRVARA